MRRRVSGNKQTAPPTARTDDDDKEADEKFIVADILKEIAI
jgi:hypothetical protein